MLVDAVNERLQQQQDDSYGDYIPRNLSFLDGCSPCNYGYDDYNYNHCPRRRTSYPANWSCPYSGYAQDRQAAIDEASLQQAAELYDYLLSPQAFPRGCQEQPASRGVTVETKPVPSASDSTTAPVPSDTPLKSSDPKGKSKQVDADASSTNIPIESTESSTDSETDSEAERAADPRAIQASLSTILEINSSFEKLDNEFVFPDELDLESPSEGNTDLKLAYTSRNAPVRYYDHALQQLLSNLDAVSSFGSKAVREQRKAVVEKIERSLEKLEKKIEEKRELLVWKMKKSASAAVAEADDTVVDEDMKAGESADAAFPESSPDSQTVEEAEADEGLEKNSAAIGENGLSTEVLLESLPESWEAKGKAADIDPEMVVIGPVDAAVSESPSGSQTIDGVDEGLTSDVDTLDDLSESGPTLVENPAELSVHPPTSEYPTDSSSESTAQPLQESPLLTGGPERDAIFPGVESELSEWVSTTVDGPASSSSRTALTLDSDAGSSSLPEFSPVSCDTQFAEVAVDPSSSEDNLPAMSELVQLSETSPSESPSATALDAIPMNEGVELDTLFEESSPSASSPMTTPPLLPIEEDAVLVEAPTHEDEQEDAWVDVEA
jgi:ElaB/YqjD/DUF883 family membrane-anchored ribosome-binding protein/rubredoxin